MALTAALQDHTASVINVINKCEWQIKIKKLKMTEKSTSRTVLLNVASDEKSSAHPIHCILSVTFCFSYHL